jgi:hypothetical protein
MSDQFAKKLEDDLTLKDTICDQICTDFKDLIAETYIRRCLPDEYKQRRKRRDLEESSEKSNSELRHSVADDTKY